MDEASSNGLSNHFASCHTVPILCIDEAHTFLTKLQSISKAPQANLMMERLCKCFEGDCWNILKEIKESALEFRLQECLYCPLRCPNNVWPKILRAENGLAERVLFFYQKMEEKDLEEMSQQCDQLAEFSMTLLHVVLEQIYAEQRTNSVHPNSKCL